MIRMNKQITKTVQNVGRQMLVIFTDGLMQNGTTTIRLKRKNLLKLRFQFLSF